MSALAKPTLAGRLQNTLDEIDRLAVRLGKLREDRGIIEKQESEVIAQINNLQKQFDDDYSCIKGTAPSGTAWYRRAKTLKPENDSGED